MRRSLALGPFAVVVVSLAFAACGGKKELKGVDGGAASASASSSAAPTAVATSAAPDAERDKQITRACTNKCERECEAKAHDRKDFYDEKKAEIPKSPFDVKVDRVWLRGQCHKGDKPEKRDDTDGITTLVEGKITYKGEDPLFVADLDGWAYLDIADDRVASVPAMEKTYSGWGGPKLVTKLERKARGSDPWRKGEARAFHWESQAISEAFCEVKPRAAGALIELRTLGVKSPVKTYPIAMVPVPWDEVVGMAIKEHVSIHRGDDKIDEAADASFVKLDKILVTMTGGKVEWMPRTSIIESGFFARGSAPKLPTVLESPSWSVSVTKISGAKDSGGYSPAGEDQFVAIVDVELTSKVSEGKPTKAKSFGFQLETSPGNWASPIGKAEGQLDGSADIGPGEKLSGRLVFPRQRFERPFRLQVKTPDRQTLFAEVFTYDLGPESWK